MNQTKKNVRSLVAENICVQSHCQKTLVNYREQQTPDVFLISGDGTKRIPAHRCILTASSEYFKTMFNIDMTERAKNEVVIKKVNADILEKLVDFCYTGEFSVTNNNIWGLLSAASMLMFNELLAKCAKFLESVLFENPTNCLFLYSIANLYNFDALINHAATVAADLFETIENTNAFLNISFEMLKTILEKKESIAMKEEEIFEMVMKWIEHNEPERKHFLPEVLGCLSLRDMDSSFLEQEVRPICLSNNWHEVAFDAKRIKISDDKDGITLIKNSPVLLLVSDGGDNEDEEYEYTIHDWLDRCDYCGVGHCDRSAADGIEYKVIFGYFCFKNKRYQLLDEITLDYSINGENFLVNNSNLYVFGTENMKVDLKSFEITKLSKMNITKSDFGIAFLNGFFYTVGGGYSKKVERYSPYDDKWSFVKELSDGRSKPQTVVVNNYLYVIGGCINGKFTKSCEYYDPLKNQWTKMSDMIRINTKPHICVLNDLIYVFGTKTDQQSNTRIYVQIYDTKLDAWSKVSTKTTHTDFSAVTVIENEIIKFGRQHGSSTKAIFEKFDIRTNKWTEICSTTHLDLFCTAPVLTKFLE